MAYEKRSRTYYNLLECGFKKCKQSKKKTMYLVSCKRALLEKKLPLEKKKTNVLKLPHSVLISRRRHFEKKLQQHDVEYIVPKKILKKLYLKYITNTTLIKKSKHKEIYKVVPNSSLDIEMPKNCVKKELMCQNPRKVSFE